MGEPEPVPDLDLLEYDDVRVLAARGVDTKKADDRGRVTLGTPYADKWVTVAVLAVESEPPSDDEDDDGGGE